MIDFPPLLRAFGRGSVRRGRTVTLLSRAMSGRRALSCSLTIPFRRAGLHEIARRSIGSSTFGCLCDFGHEQRSWEVETGSQVGRRNSGSCRWDGRGECRAPLCLWNANHRSRSSSSNVFSLSCDQNVANSRGSCKARERIEKC